MDTIPHAVLRRLAERVETSKTDSDFTLFFSLLIFGEALVKLCTLGIISAISEDQDRNRYRLEYTLAHADGIGEWGRVMEDAVSGPASQFLCSEAYGEQSELTRQCKSGEWQYEAVVLIKKALDSLGLRSEELPSKTDLRRWFRLFAVLRNGTRGHGATLPMRTTEASELLQQSILLLCNNLRLFSRPWGYLHRNLSGRYRVSAITPDVQQFAPLKQSTEYSFANGVYVYFDTPRLVPLLVSDSDLQDFYLANGGFTRNQYEVISYATDQKEQADGTQYLMPPGQLPPSETEGLIEFTQMGRCLSNVPQTGKEYVPRPVLEHDLETLLLDDRHPIVTLVGRGGIGKTSLALATLERVAQKDRFEVIVWFSARDIDLLPSGPKTVRPHVLSPQDVSNYYVSLINQDLQKDKNFNPQQYLEQQLRSNDLGPCLYVFDNFETSQSSLELFSWIDTHIRLPNKILITTRLREFKGDYPIEVLGMTDEEGLELIRKTAISLNIDGIVTRAYSEKLVEEAEGHPYVIKILLGEVSKERKLLNIPRLMANRDEILTALFERTYGSLSPICQRVFLTLAAWNSTVPRIAVEAVLLRSADERVDVSGAIDRLRQYSLVEVLEAPDHQGFLSLPLAAAIYGKKKLNVSPLRSAVQADVELLQLFGPTKRLEIGSGFRKRMENLIENLAKIVDRGGRLDDYMPVLSMLCENYNDGWLILAGWLLEAGDEAHAVLAKDAARRFIENTQPGEAEEGVAEAWRIVAKACHLEKDALGEIHAFIERSQISSVPFYDLANTANRLNALLKEHQLDLQKDEKGILANRLLVVLDQRQNEANADDYSRMAWLALHLKREDKARSYVERGLALNPDNLYCKKLSEKLG